MSPIEKPDPPASIDYHRNSQHHHHQEQQPQQQQQQHHLKQQYQHHLHLHNQRDEPKSIIGQHRSLNNHLISSNCDSDIDKLKSDGNESDDNNNNHNNFRICENFNDISNNSNNTNSKNYLKDHLYETIDDIPKCECNRQLFGIQLEVTSLLLEAERRKLAVLQRELQAALEDSGSVKKAKEQIKQELILAISRIQVQYDVLETEYKHHAIGRLRSSNTRGLGKKAHQQQQQQQQQTRPKPAVPVKPTNIPPKPAQICKDGCNTAQHGRSKARISQTIAIASGHTSMTMAATGPAMGTTTKTTPSATSVDLKASYTLPSSPNIAFGNDCCGMLMPSNSKNEMVQHVHQVQSVVSNNNNNNNNNHLANHQNHAQPCDEDSGGGGALSPPMLSISSSLSMSCNKLVQSLNCTCNTSTETHQHQLAANEGIDAASTVSSCSGGFRDSDFISKQAAYAAVHTNISPPQAGKTVFESPKKQQYVTTTSSTPIPTNISATSNAINISTQKLQFMQTSKQIDQMLAQRLIASTNQQTPAAGGSSSTIGKHTATSLTTDSPSSSSSSSITSPSNVTKKRMSSSYGSSADTAIFYHQQSSVESTGSGKSAISLQFNRLQEEMKQQCKIIQDKHLIERRPPQKHYRPVSSNDSTSNRSQPAIGLKQTPKSRVSYFSIFSFLLITFNLIVINKSQAKV